MTEKLSPEAQSAFRAAVTEIDGINAAEIARLRRTLQFYAERLTKLLQKAREFVDICACGGISNTDSVFEAEAQAVLDQIDDMPAPEPPAPASKGQFAEIIARDTASADTWFNGPKSATAMAIRDRRTLLAELFSAGASFQSRVQPWMLECFGAEIAADKVERNHRFLEESLELGQARGCTKEEVLQLVEYVYSRPAGDPPQEVGGVMVTLAALCASDGIDMHVEAETELARIWTKIDVIRAKQAGKPKWSPLPQRKCQANMYADPPRDCDAPFCGCNPEWIKVIEMLQECGWQSPQELRASAEPSLEHRGMGPAGRQERSCSEAGSPAEVLSGAASAASEGQSPDPEQAKDAARWRYLCSCASEEWAALGEIPDDEIDAVVDRHIDEAQLEQDADDAQRRIDRASER